VGYQDFLRSYPRNHLIRKRDDSCPTTALLGW
jgi:hypothetical protein